MVYKNVGGRNWKMIPSIENTVREIGEHTQNKNSLRGMLKSMLNPWFYAFDL